jgi:hypothetical protein
MPILHDALLFASTLILVISAAPVEERAANGIEPQLPSPLVVPPSQYWCALSMHDPAIPYS